MVSHIVPFLMTLNDLQVHSHIDAYIFICTLVQQLTIFNRHSIVLLEVAREMIGSFKLQKKKKWISGDTQ